MNLLEKAFNVVVAAMRWISRVEPASEAAAKATAANRRTMDATLGYRVVKVMVRADGRERVRIVQKGRDFGAVVDFAASECGWSPAHILGGGIIYESAVSAEAEARAVLHWLKHWKKVSGQMPALNMPSKDSTLD